MAQLDVEAVSSPEGFLGLRQEWNALLEAGPDPSPFLGHEWLTCWWRAFGGRSLLRILLFKDGDRLIGIAPLMLTRTTFRGLPVAQLSFMENEESSRAGFICFAPREREVLASAAAYLAALPGWQVMALRKIPERPGGVDLGGMLEGAGLKVCRRTTLQSPQMAISGDWATFWAQTSQRFKKRLRYNQNRLAKAGAVEVQELRDQEAIERVLPDLFAVGQRCWKSGLKNSIACRGEVRNFFSLLPRELGPRGGLSVWLLRLGGKPVAFEYHLRSPATLHGLRAEFDEGYRDYSPGAVLDAHIVSQLFGSDVRLYDMGGTSDDYKLHCTSETLSHHDFIAFRGGLYSRSLHAIEAHLIPSLRRFRRQGTRRGNH